MQGGMLGARSAPAAASSWLRRHPQAPSGQAAWAKALACVAWGPAPCAAPPTGPCRHPPVVRTSLACYAVIALLLSTRMLT